jgi:hypothetical protein
MNFCLSRRRLFSPEHIRVIVLNESRLELYPQLAWNTLPAIIPQRRVNDGSGKRSSYWLKALRCNQGLELISFRIDLALWKSQQSSVKTLEAG